MADFRKWFMVIAVVLLAAASANAGSQITTIPCYTSAQPPVIRDGGVTEYIGEVDLNCDSTNVNATVTPTVTVQFGISVNTVVTNATTTAIDNLGPLTMAGVAVQQTTPPQTIIGVYQGRVGNNFGNPNNTLRFPHVILPMGTLFTVRFFNVRVSALPLSNAFGGTQILGLVAANTENPSGYAIGFTNQPTQGIVVALVQPTYSFAVTDCGGTATTASISFQQCQDYTLNHMAKDADPGVLAVSVYGVKFTELQQTAFKNIVEEDGATIPASGSIPAAGQVCDTGHGGTGYKAVFADVPGVPTCASPLAWVSNGTRLLATFNIQASLVGKVHIYVSQFQTASTNAAVAAELVAINNVNGWGNDQPLTTAGKMSCTLKNVVGGASNNAWVMLPDGAAETAAWEITTDNLGDKDDVTFAWTMTYAENTLPPMASTANAVTLTGNIGPVSTQAAPLPVAITVQPVVRFALPGAPGAATVSIIDCVTNLLFPYVTDISGYQTGIAIANTSLDSAWNGPNKPTTDPDPNWGASSNPMPYNDVPQAGPCSLYLFGSSKPQNMAGAGTAVQTIASGASPSIAGGQVFADTINNIFNIGTGGNVITGYIIARCSFQYGHGYAYVINQTGQPQSYLALIIPDRSVMNGYTGSSNFWDVPENMPVRVAVPFSNAIYDEEGEMLGN